MAKQRINIPDTFYKEEKRSDYIVSEKTKKLWAIELEMLNELRRVCEKYNLVFYADSGTLLGAVREHGFVPWDDDIDVVMFRKDYDKLLEISTKEFKKPFFLQCTYSDKEYYKGHAQIRYDGTTAILRHEGKKVPFHQGIFLDIFPLDYTSSSVLAKKIKCYSLRYYRKLFYSWGDVHFNNCLREKYRILKSKLCNRIGKRKIFKHFEKKCKNKKGKSKTVDKVSYYWKYKQYKNLEDEYFGAPLYFPFEFTEIPVPCEYDIILKKYYGENYMTPLKVKSGHQSESGNMIIDPERSYLDVIKEL